MGTYTPKPGEIERRWHVIDANNIVLGRLASQAATLLRGKHKPQFAQHVDTGDFVVVDQRRQGRGVPVQARRAPLSPLRLPGRSVAGDRRRSARAPSRALVELAVRGMLPKNTLGRAQLKKLKVYAGPEHPHAAQKPQPFEIKQVSASDFSPVPIVGRRKEAIVRVRLVPGTGEFKLNGRTLENYFPNKVHQQLIREPFVTLEKDGQFDVIASLSGGGITGQAGALRLAIARALIGLEPDDRPALKKAGFLTRDPRVKERKKYGLKKARKAPQYSKR